MTVRWCYRWCIKLVSGVGFLSDLQLTNFDSYCIIKTVTNFLIVIHILIICLLTELRHKE